MSQSSRVIVAPESRVVIESHPELRELLKSSHDNGFGTNPISPRSESDNMMTRAFTGMGLLVCGAMLMGFGSRGLAGSGVILDPQRAREDLKPWSHMAGGMVDDAASQSATLSKIVDKADDYDEPIVKVRCSACRNLNDESAKFCDECGAKL